MLKVVSRKEALGMIDSIFTSFHFGLMSLTDSGIENSWGREYFWTEANRVDQGRLTKEYEQTVNSLDAAGFHAYYKFIGEFATKYKIGCWKEYNDCEPIAIEALNNELPKYNKTSEKFELINSFKVEELQSDKFLFSSKFQLLQDILDDRAVINENKQCINKILASFNKNDKTAFLNELQNNPKLLDKLLTKIAGNEQEEMIIILGDLFIISGFIQDHKRIFLNNKSSDYITAIYDKGSVVIAINKITSEFEFPERVETRKVNPFDIICINYKEQQVEIPAFVLTAKQPANEEKIYKKFSNNNFDVNKTIEEFKTANPAEQYIILKSAVDEKKGTEKGKIAQALRNVRDSFKLNTLFSEHNDFMNEDLRDFLNCKEDGTENYTIEEVVNGCGWFEYPSRLAACHQQQHNKTKSGRPLFNAKFGNRDGREVVFKSNFSIVKEYPDKGTYNYAVPGNSKSTGEHKKYDVDPFYPLMDKLGYGSGLIKDSLFWGGKAIWDSKAFWEKTSYIFGYNTEVWDLLQDEKVYGDGLMSKKEEFEVLKESSLYNKYKNDEFKQTYKVYPQSYIDYFIQESKKYE